MSRAPRQPPEPLTAESETQGHGTRAQSPELQTRSPACLPGPRGVCHAPSPRPATASSHPLPHPLPPQPAPPQIPDGLFTAFSKAVSGLPHPSRLLLWTG